MTDPISSTDRRILESHFALDDPPPTPLPAHSRTTTRELPVLPDTNDQAVRQMVRSALQKARTVEVTPELTVGGDSRIQQRMDAFFSEMRPTYRLPDGSGVQVPTPFRLVPSDRTDDYGKVEANVDRNHPALQRIAESIGLSRAQVGRMQQGRATPEELRRLTQALIDAGRLPNVPGLAAAKRVRLMMADHGLGLDCAGYTQQAFLAAHGLSRAEASLRPRLENDDLSGLASRGLRPVSVDDVRAGDLLILKPPSSEQYGHTTIVYDRSLATDAELHALRALAQKIPGFCSGHVTKIVLDSSWGSGGDPNKGGVMRVAMYHDDETGMWAWPDGRTLQVGPLPYEHEIDGAYRPREKPDAPPSRP